MLPALIAGGSALAGAVLTNRSNRRMTKEANIASAREAALNRDFQASMSSTSYQRGMEDLRLAGLNPVLAGKFGGASTPSGSSASQSASRDEDAIGKGVSTSMAYKRQVAELENMKAQNANLVSQNLVNVASARKLNAEANLVPYQMNKEKMLSPAYQAGGKIVESIVGSAKSAKGVLSGKINTKHDFGKNIKFDPFWRRK